MLGFTLFHLALKIASRADWRGSDFDVGEAQSVTLSEVGSGDGVRNSRTRRSKSRLGTLLVGYIRLATGGASAPLPRVQTTFTPHISSCSTRRPVDFRCTQPAATSTADERETRLSTRAGAGRSTTRRTSAFLFAACCFKDANHFHHARLASLTMGIKGQSQRIGLV